MDGGSAGVRNRYDPIKEVDGWKTLVMVQRYAHLAPGHLHDGVERLSRRMLQN